MLEKSAENYTR